MLPDLKAVIPHVSLYFAVVVVASACKAALICQVLCNGISIRAQQYGIGGFDGLATVEHNIRIRMPDIICGEFVIHKILVRLSSPVRVANCKRKHKKYASFVKTIRNI